MGGDNQATKYEKTGHQVSRITNHKFKNLSQRDNDSTQQIKEINKEMYKCQVAISLCPKSRIYTRKEIVSNLH